ncbi:hypothetical protein BDY21DRAFT_92512 [Lineolata rhizophorae]|uniref:LsmAD domain-containing protein n=1 Tax=Lineolata rhizophorae TaxID=578093 RepID=A0A6A6PCR5_9PEZI|nr:hypothetical protein BDY21DRAFT_92512 [Lineolata rhizophorae]
MSTTAASPSTTDKASASNNSAGGPANAGGSKAQLKMNTAGKSMDGARRQQSASPVDGAGAQRKPQKAWTQGTNPITQRANNQSTTNGVASPSLKASPAVKAMPSSPKEMPTPEQLAYNRLTFLTANFMGLTAYVTLADGEQYCGIFSGATLEPYEARYVLKMVKRVPAEDQKTNGTTEQPYIGVGEDHVMTFDLQDVVDLEVNNVTSPMTRGSQNGVSSFFRTDTEISSGLAARERNLEPWEDTGEGSIDMTLEDSGKGGWDQFEVNERKFGAKSTYREEYYTTSIDRSNPRYNDLAAKADKIAREIEGSTPMNEHIAEERGSNVPNDSSIDEEDKYSGVKREYPPLPSGQPNKYTPPARRAPTGQPTVPGAPVDPAIISSQLAGPISSKDRPSQSPSANQPVQPPAADSKKPAATTTATTAPTPAPAVPAKVLTPSNPKSVTAMKQSGQVSGATTTARKAGKPENATANVEHDLLDSFKAFSAAEKLRMQERQRQAARADKQVKLNDLRKFAQNFKLNTPIPKDLVPILAKDTDKQEKIVAKARVQAEEFKKTPPKPASAVAVPPSSAAPPPQEQPKPQRPQGPRYENGQPPQNVQSDRQSGQRGSRQNQNYQQVRQDRQHGQNMPPIAPNNHRGPGMLSQRLTINQQMQKQPGMPPHMHPNMQPMHGLQIPPPGPPPHGPSATTSASHTPTSSLSTKFNVQAMEFTPSTNFQPRAPSANNSKAPSPPEIVRARPEPKRASTNFLGSKKPAPISSRPKVRDAFNPIKRMKIEVVNENWTKDYEKNGGIPLAYRTPPTWEHPDTNRDKSYEMMFESPPPRMAPSISPPHSVPSGPMAPHHGGYHPQQGLQQPPGHGFNPPHMTPHQTPRHMPAQPHHGPAGGAHHYDDHRMQYSQSTSSVNPSPRAVPPYMATPASYGGAPGQPLLYHPNAMPQYGMSPGSQHVIPFRQGGPGAAGAPQFMGGHMQPMHGGQMMTGQPSNGPYIMSPQGFPIYPTGPTQIYQPQHGAGPGGPVPSGAPPPPPPPPSGAANSGYPSPRPGAPMMAHQGSQQGHQPPNAAGMPTGGMPQQQMFYVPHGAQQGGPMFAGQGPPGPMTHMRGPYQQPAGPPAGQSYLPPGTTAGQQPHYGTSPRQGHHYPHQPGAHPGPGPQYHHPRGTPSATYAQPVMGGPGIPPGAATGGPPHGPAGVAPPQGPQIHAGGGAPPVPAQGGSGQTGGAEEGK